MKQLYRDPDFFTFKGLAEKLGISQNRIENDYKTGKIARFLMDNQNTKAILPTRRRVAKLMPLLNQYAREHLDEGPLSLLTVLNVKQVDITDTQLEQLRNNINKDTIFQLWLKVYGIDIDTIKLVIPLDEALEYEKYLKEDSGNNVERRVVPENQQTPEEYIAEMKRQGEKDAVIAVYLSEKFSEINAYLLMKFINPKKVAEWEQSTAKVGRPKQWFYDLKKIGLQILKEREKMTSSETQNSAS